MSEGILLMLALKAAQEIVAHVFTKKSQKRKKSRGDKGLAEPGIDESGSVGLKKYAEPVIPKNGIRNQIMIEAMHFSLR